MSQSPAPEPQYPLADSLYLGSKTSQMVSPLGPPSPDELAGMNWWNAMSEGQRLAALQAAGTPTPAVAWAHYKTTRSNAS